MPFQTHNGLPYHLQNQMHDDQEIHELLQLILKLHYVNENNQIPFSTASQDPGYPDPPIM